MNKDELNLFRIEIFEDITDKISADKSGGMMEEKFTATALEYLEDAGETEGAVLCREIRENSVGNRVHKINGYALSESYETIDLFITIFKGLKEMSRLYSEEVKAALNLSTRFFKNVLTGKMNGIEETAPVFDFVNTINAISKEIVRVNIFILSDMLIPIDSPEASQFQGIKLNYHIRDIEYLHRIHTSGTGKQTIIIDFIKTFKEPVPCLPMPEKNEDYDSYLCIMPAHMLADIYHEYGARLLEQNVRTFLQFRGDINKGIRETILKEPHMFMAYNNGISATAESVVLTGDQQSITSITDFQIVNGGQTTASIFQTRRKYKTADISSVCVQVKLSVIRDPEKRPRIVSLISRYANTQNKVSEADLSSNHPFHIELEQLSRKIWTPAGESKNQTRWYYERARGQYNDELSQLDSKAQQKRWLTRNPKNQKFAKEDLARFYVSWEMQPWWVVRGRQRGFAEFMKIADDLEVNRIFYEDLVANAILFRAAERLYGSGAKAIGDLRYMVVPYTISWLNYVTEGKVNLGKIWKKQGLSLDFEKLLSSVLRKVDKFMRDTAPGGLIGEWAKKEECWKQLKGHDLNTDLFPLKNELFTVAQLSERYEASSMNAGQIKQIQKRIKKINTDGLLKIAQWGKVTSELTIQDLNLIWRIVMKIENEKNFTDKELLEMERILEKYKDSHIE